MRALVMRGVIVTRMMVVVLVFTRRDLCIAQDKCETSTHWRQHEARWNERPKEQQSEDEQRCPSWFLHVPHPFHRCADLRAISANPSRPWRHFAIFRHTAHTGMLAGQSARRIRERSVTGDDFISAFNARLSAHSGFPRRGVLSSLSGRPPAAAQGQKSGANGHSDSFQAAMRLLDPSEIARRVCHRCCKLLRNLLAFPNRLGSIPIRMRRLVKSLGLLLLLMVAQQGAVVHELGHVSGASSSDLRAIIGRGRRYVLRAVSRLCAGRHTGF